MNKTLNPPRKKIMKTIIFYDTETTWFPNWSAPSEDPSQPRIISIAAELCIEETGAALGAINFLILPDATAWKISEEIQKLTGISNELVAEFGVPMNFALNGFMELWLNADMRCAHNESFDMRMVRIELMRHAFYAKETLLLENPPQKISYADYWKEQPAFCTQGKSTKIIGLPPSEKMVAAGRNSPKPPNLAEAYRHFTGQEIVNAHSAWADMQACKAVYYGIKKHLADQDAAAA